VTGSNPDWEREIFQGKTVEHGGNSNVERRLVKGKIVSGKGGGIVVGVGRKMWAGRFLSWKGN